MTDEELSIIESRLAMIARGQWDLTLSSDRIRPTSTTVSVVIHTTFNPDKTSEEWYRTPSVISDPNNTGRGHNEPKFDAQAVFVAHAAKDVGALIQEVRRLWGATK